MSIRHCTPLINWVLEFAMIPHTNDSTPASQAFSILFFDSLSRGCPPVAQSFYIRAERCSEVGSFLESVGHVSSDVSLHMFMGC